MLSLARSRKSEYDAIFHPNPHHTTTTAITSITTTAHTRLPQPRYHLKYRGHEHHHGTITAIYANTAIRKALKSGNGIFRGRYKDRRSPGFMIM